MPEGDTLRRLADSLSKHFAGERVVSSLFRHPRLATVDLAGHVLVEADAVGKHLLLRFSNGFTLHFHLRMSGGVYQRFVREVASHRRKCELQLERGWVVGVDLPVMELFKTRDEQRLIGHLGPDVCGRYDHSAALGRLQEAGSISISQALLDQRIVAGFGNIYAVETPFIVGVNPFALTNQISNLNGLLSIAVALIRTNARYGPQNTTGHHLKSTEHWVLSKNIYQCKVCGASITRLFGGETPWQRRTAWCDTCQPRRNLHADLRRAVKLLSLHPCRRIVNLATGELCADTSQPVRAEGLRPNEGRQKRMK